MSDHSAMNGSLAQSCGRKLLSTVLGTPLPLVTTQNCKIGTALRLLEYPEYVGLGKIETKDLLFYYRRGSTFE
jgi:hypothetical protein